MLKLIGAGLLLVTMTTGVLADGQRMITTMGRGVVEAVPDMASIDVGVTHQAETADAALARTSEAVADVIARLTDAGIAPRDMQTQGLSLQPVWNRQSPGADLPREITGFVARNTLSVRVRDLGILGEILDAVVRDGANTFNGLQFGLQDPSAAIGQARAEAVNDAMTKAQQLADAAGVTLGPVQTLSEGGGAPRPMMMEMASARMAADVPVAAGEVTLSAQVSMTFSILD